jgi:hypothetical protein
MEIEGVPEHSAPILITRQFLGELEVRQILPLLQVPPTGGGNQTAVPLAKQGEPNGGGLQKVSCNEIPSRVHF